MKMNNINAIYDLKQYHGIHSYEMSDSKGL